MPARRITDKDPDLLRAARRHTADTQCRRGWQPATPQISLFCAPPWRPPRIPQPSRSAVLGLSQVQTYPMQRWHIYCVQDRYAADLGDYLKLGLLRWLVPTGEPASPRLGVVWYQTVGETHNGDGKHIAYLAPEHRSAARLRQLDPELYDRLAAIVAAGERSTAALAGAGVLGPAACFFGDVLDFRDLPVNAGPAREERRRSWLKRAEAATAGCDLIFADPDNGIRSAHHRVPAHRTKAVKNAYLDELAGFARRGQSLIVYHHADRSAAVKEQAARRLEDLGREVPVEPIAAVRASRGTTRLFLVAASASHAQYLTDRLTALTASQWESEFKVYWY
jgi:hypothetical protein